MTPTMQFTRKPLRKICNNSTRQKLKSLRVAKLLHRLKSCIKMQTETHCAQTPYATVALENSMHVETWLKETHSSKTVCAQTALLSTAFRMSRLVNPQIRKPRPCAANRGPTSTRSVECNRALFSSIPTSKTAPRAPLTRARTRHPSQKARRLS